MQQRIDINLLKSNPQLFFSKLSEDAENEFVNLVQYIVFKYDIKLDDEMIDEKNSATGNLLDVFSSLRTGLPKNYKFDREEANER
jgi:putative lipoic acid-binding regulatory protein